MIRQLRPQGGLDLVLLQILRLGVYELVELGLPDHVINDHVDMARKLVRPEAAPVANGNWSSSAAEPQGSGSCPGS